MLFYHISELMLPTLIKRYKKNHFIFDSKTRAIENFIGCHMPHFMTIYQFIKPFLDKKKMSIFQE